MTNMDLLRVRNRYTVFCFFTHAPLWIIVNFAIAGAEYFLRGGYVEVFNWDVCLISAFLVTIGFTVKYHYSNQWIKDYRAFLERKYIYD